MNLLNNISYFIIINGIYDILSALTILNFLKIPYIKTLRLSLITKNTEPESILERFIGYSILANGLIRIMNGMTLNEQPSQVIVAGTYFLEAFIMANEYYYYKSVDFQKSMFLICFSLYLGYLSIINYFN
tara:strand:- start:2726 stop:3115 length:390 start_codon:yes stop_codon:yes gene_type:complete